MNLKELDLSKTVYSFYYPEVESLIDEFLKSIDDSFHKRYFNSSASKQDEFHLSFFEGFKNWSAPVLDVEWNDFPFMYPTGGASEAIREQIVYLKTQGYNKLYVLEGEYEGYEAIAKVLGFSIVKIPQEAILDMNTSFFDDEKSIFFVSNPNSVDGNINHELIDYIGLLNISHSHIRFYLDIVYIGTLAKEKYTIHLKKDNIDGIFFSLSKSFGVYYHRIGGCFLKYENPLLYGNKWFKNLLSLQIGELLMKNFDIFYLPNKYIEKKRMAIASINKILGGDYTSAHCSECILLTTVNKIHFDENSFNELARFKKHDNIRLCLTTILEKLSR